MHLITICLLFLTVSIRVENKYISEYTQRSKKLIIYAGLATLCQTHLFTIKYDGNLPPVQLLHPHSNTMLRIQYVTILFVAGKIAVGTWMNGKSVSSAVVKNTWMYKSTQQYAPTYFEYCTTIVQQKHCGIHVLDILILEGLSLVAKSDYSSKWQLLFHVLFRLKLPKLNALIHSVFLCFEWISVQKPITSLNSNSWFVLITYTELVKRRGNWFRIQLNLNDKYFL